jgi:hypothetical protein
MRIWIMAHHSKTNDKMDKGANNSDKSGVPELNNDFSSSTAVDPAVARWMNDENWGRNIVDAAGKAVTLSSVHALGAATMGGIVGGIMPQLVMSEPKPSPFRMKK